MEKAEQVSDEDRELVRSELYSLAERLRQRLHMTPKEVNSLLHEMLDVTV